MPDIAPFRGILYDRTKVDFAKVLAPPYDVIDAAERARLAQADPHNAVRLILPEAADGADKYQTAAKTFQAWLAAGVLKRDDRKAVYRYTQVFTHPDLGAGRETTRTGFIAGVRLHEFHEKVVLPHERTLSAPKEDRLALMTATSAHFSQIFALFRDQSGDVERLFRKVERENPVFDVRMADGVRHVLWRMADAEAIGKLRHLMSPKKLYIADGHHRYETMLALRQKLGGDKLSQYSAAQYATMFLCPMDQEGLVILPTHRVLHGLAGFTAQTLLDKAKEYFIVERLDNAAKDGAVIRRAVGDALAHQPALAVVFPGDPHAWKLTLAPQVNALALGLASRAVAKLDVTILHGLILEKILGITPAAQEAETNLRYVKDSGAALAELGTAGVQAVFLLSPSSVETVRHVADLGEVMPQKSTYFFPKIASGAVINQIDPDEDLI